jgi:hypothetical protein
MYETCYAIHFLLIFSSVTFISSSFTLLEQIAMAKNTFGLQENSRQIPLIVEPFDFTGCEGVKYEWKDVTNLFVAKAKGDFI